MGGNRKYGYRRSNRGGFRGEPWFCHGCNRLHPYSRFRNGTLDGRSLCDRSYNREQKSPDPPKVGRKGTNPFRFSP